MNNNELVSALEEMLHMASYSSDADQIEKFQQAVDYVEQIIKDLNK